MYGAGPQQNTTRSARSGASSRSISTLRKPRSPLQGSRGASRSHTGTTRTVGTVLAIVSSSRRKMMSDGVRALCTNTTSASEPRSYRVRVIDMTGVIPLPPERKRYFADAVAGDREDAEGAVGRDALPGGHRVVQPVRHEASGLALDRDPQQVGTRRRRGDRVAPADGAAVDLQLQRDELARLVLEQRGLGRFEEEGLDVVGDVLDLPADQRRAVGLAPHGDGRTVAVAPWRGTRSSERRRAPRGRSGPSSLLPSEPSAW